MSGFTFRQFHLEHDACAMKVGTDGVLLGAWVPLPAVPQPQIVDVGCGCGLIALMLAQRLAGAAHIDALDVDEPAAQQAAVNVQHSPWPETVTVHSLALVRWQPEAPVDLVVSNPPFFHAALHNPDERRSRARHQDAMDALDAMQLCAFAARWLTATGVLAVVIPAGEWSNWRHAAAWHGLSVRRRCQVQTAEHKPVARLLLVLAREVGAVVETSLVLQRPADGRAKGRSADFDDLTAAFYLDGGLHAQPASSLPSSASSIIS